VSTLLIVGVMSLTSISFYLVGSRRLGLSTGDLRGALRKMLDCVGTIAIFSVFNLLVGGAVILGVRFVSGHFVSLYLLEDEVWWALSGLQGLTWSLWRQAKG
jgi:hypothetical protein